MNKKYLNYFLLFMLLIYTNSVKGQIIKGVGDFDGDGNSQILWQTSDGFNYIKNVSDAQACEMLGGSFLNPIGAGDFDNDGKDDIVWRDSLYGNVSISFMNGSNTKKWIDLRDNEKFIPYHLKIEGIGDFSGDGKSEILWRYPTGLTLISDFDDDGKILKWNTISLFIDPKSTVVEKIGDINGDNKDDVVWRNINTGNTVIGLMSASAVLQWKSLTNVPIPLLVKIEAIGDFDGNGRKDILWRNSQTNNIVISHHGSDAGVVEWRTISGAQSTASLKVHATGKFGNSSKDEILWSNTTNNSYVISSLSSNSFGWRIFDVKKDCYDLKNQGIYYLNTSQSDDFLDVGENFNNKYGLKGLVNSNVSLFEYDQSDAGQFSYARNNIDNLNFTDQIFWLNKMGAMGYVRLNSKTFVKRYNDNLKFEYKYILLLGKATNEIVAELNLFAAQGWRYASIQFGVVNGVYQRIILLEKSNLNNSYHYKTVTFDLFSDFSQYMDLFNSMGQQGYALKIFLDNSQALFVKKLNSSTKYEFNSIQIDSYPANSQDLMQINKFAAKGYKIYDAMRNTIDNKMYYMFYKGERLCNKGSFICDRPGGL